jgi:hypothetical protein
MMSRNSGWQPLASLTNADQRQTTIHRLFYACPITMGGVFAAKAGKARIRSSFSWFQSKSARDVH